MKKWFAGIVVAIVLFGGACDLGTSSNNGAARKDSATAAKQLTGFQTNQPVPVFTYSQLRQNLIELESAQAQTTQTTTFFFNMGVPNPISSCPSIGFPIPSTDQLTNPQTVEEHNSEHGGGNVSLPQIESTGVYTGDSTGTYVMCINAQGQPYASYWEGFVQTVTGPAAWVNGQITLTGPPSFGFTKGKK